MNKTELIATVAEKTGLSKKDADIDFELAEIEIKQALTRMKVKKHRLG